MCVLILQGRRWRWASGVLKNLCLGQSMRQVRAGSLSYCLQGKWAKWPACVFSFLREYFSALREAPALKPPWKPLLLISSLPYRLGANSQGLWKSVILTWLALALGMETATVRLPGREVTGGAMVGRVWFCMPSSFEATYWSGSIKI